MTQLIDPLYDIGFKLLLGRENVSEELLMDFLNAVFAGDPVLSNITSVRYLNNERAGEWDKAKGIRYDIMCQTSEGHKFIVEMQKASQRNFVKRGGYYVCRAIAEQGHKGKEEDTVTWEYEITPVIGVFLCNFHVNSLPPKTLTKVRMMDEETKEPVGDFMRLIFIQLPSFRKEESECDTIFDKWIYNLKNMGHSQTVDFQPTNEIFHRDPNMGN
ncbi:MAG: Rpn family recombination-promoting nuclease/putative transposase, partial [Muribaculaceae bacterium]|nr:Rpn family recombination-promoting nuclease/putative transposase [Muribaculaceae bacterium]